MTFAYRSQKSIAARASVTFPPRSAAPSHAEWAENCLKLKLYGTQGIKGLVRDSRYAIKTLHLGTQINRPCNITVTGRRRQAKRD